MHTVHKTPRVTVSQRATGDLEADVLAIPVFEDDTFADEPGLDAAAGGDVSAAHARKEFRGKLYEVFQTHAGLPWKTPRVLLVGAGKRQDCTSERIRRIATTAALSARQRRAPRLALVHRDGTGLGPARAVEVLAEGVTLANFEGASFKTEPDTTWLDSVELRVAAARHGGLRRLRRARRQGADDGRVLEHRAHDGERARQPPDARSSSPSGAPPWHRRPGSRWTCWTRSGSLPSTWGCCSA